MGNGNDHDANIESLLDELGWSGQVGQMAQIDINMLLTDDHTGFRQDLLDLYIGKLGAGSVLNNQNQYDPRWTIADFRAAAVQIQETAKAFGRPPVIWGLDSVHGANYLYDTVITPQPLNLAASFNVSLSHQAGLWASRDTRRAGIQWLFSPLLGLSWNPFWSRVYETFGEDPKLVGDMAQAMMRGIQEVVDDGIVPSRAAASGKHFIGYSLPRDGHDRAPSWIPMRHLYQYFVPPWKQVASEILTIMESYTEVDGVPNVANRRLLSRLLRKELKFSGMLVTDYHEIFNLAEWHHIVADRNESIRISLTEGSVDMSMIANEPDDFFAAMEKLKENEGQWSNRIRSSARRVLKLKKTLNMFQESFNMGEEEATGAGHSADDLSAALDMTEQSIVLAKNNDIFPIAADAELKVLVTGPTANQQAYTSGGWTWQWQGVEADKENQWFTYGSTVLGGLQNLDWQVSYSCGVDILGNDCDSGTDFVADGIDTHDSGILETVEKWVSGQDNEYIESIRRAIGMASHHDLVIVCLGEENYTEKPGDIRSLTLPSGQYDLVSALQKEVNCNIVLVYFGGRTRLLSPVEPLLDAIFLGFLPGPLAGDALANLMTGRVNPSAKLPVTYPKYEDGGGIPYMHAVSDMCTQDSAEILPHWANVPCDVQWPFGHGLSYSTFQFESLTLSTNQLGMGQKSTTSLDISFVVKNTSERAGSTTIMLFTFDMFRSSTPEYKRLRVFDKKWLDGSSSIDVTYSISLDDLRFVGNHDDSHYILEDGLQFVVGIGPEVDCRVDPSDARCSEVVTVKTNQDYVAACEAACSVWKTSGCSYQRGMREDECLDLCSSIHCQDGLEMNNDGWGWNYVTCIEDVSWADTFNAGDDCWKMTKLCRDVFTTPSMDQYGNSASPSPSGMHNFSESTLLLALVAGALGTVMILAAMRGGFKNKGKGEYGEVQFTPLKGQ
eukprot:Nitzschia sp. Nitz4//scaffold81_size91200//31329//34248//NITZ4_004983-RA/size91200-snap-gene-0.19-mRNA-1//1//CDS//3329558701//7028//frame0